jgi:hypothetical protein
VLLSQHGYGYMSMCVSVCVCMLVHGVEYVCAHPAARKLAGLPRHLLCSHACIGVLVYVWISVNAPLSASVSVYCVLMAFPIAGIF